MSEPVVVVDELLNFPEERNPKSELTVYGMQLLEPETHTIRRYVNKKDPGQQIQRLGRCVKRTLTELRFSVSGAVNEWMSFARYLTT
jgi:hypothetical protein